MEYGSGGFDAIIIVQVFNGSKFIDAILQGILKTVTYLIYIRHINLVFLVWSIYTSRPIIGGDRKNKIFN